MTEKRAPAPSTPSPKSRARMLELVFPSNTNYHGTAFGGWVLSLMDKAASVAASGKADSTFPRRRCHPSKNAMAISSAAVATAAGRTSGRRGGRR